MLLNILFYFCLFAHLIKFYCLIKIFTEYDCSFSCFYPCGWYTQTRVGTTIQNCFGIDSYNTTDPNRVQKSSVWIYTVCMSQIIWIYNVCLLILLFPPARGTSSGSTLLAYSLCFFLNRIFSVFKDLSNIS